MHSLSNRHLCGKWKTKAIWNGAKMGNTSLGHQRAEPFLLPLYPSPVFPREHQILFNMTAYRLAKRAFSLTLTYSLSQSLVVPSWGLERRTWLEHIRKYEAVLVNPDYRAKSPCTIRESIFINGSWAANMISWPTGSETKWTQNGKRRFPPFLALFSPFLPPYQIIFVPFPPPTLSWG